MSGWLEGLRTGASVASIYKQNKRADKDQDWEDESRDEIRRRRKEDEEIRNAGMEAIGDSQASPPPAALPVATPTQPPAAMEPVATATPIAPLGSGATPSGESLSMEPVAGGPVSQQPMASSAEPTPPPPTPPPPGSTIPQGTMPTQANMAHQDAVSGIAPTGAQPAPAQAGMRPMAQRNDMEIINQRLMAQSRKAAELGRTDLALQLHTQGMGMRDQLRTVALDEAEQRFRLSKDPNEFTEVFNRYIPNGTTIKSLTKDGDGYLAKLANDKGETRDQPMSAQDMNQYLQYMRDPKVARALEAKHAETLSQQRNDLRKAQIEHTGKMQLQQARDRFQNVGGSLVDLQSGSVFTPPKAGGDFQLKTVKDADGSEVLMRVDESGAQPLYRSSGADGAELPKQVTAMQKAASDAVMKVNGTDTDVFASAGDDKQAKIYKQIEMAADLVASNYGTDNWRGMSPAKAASIANAIESGRARIVPVQVPGSQEPVRGVKHEGRTYLLDQPVVAPQQQRAQAQRAFNGDKTVKQSQAAPKQEKRESDRKQILRDELKNAHQLLKSATTPEQEARAKQTIADISRELGMPQAGAPRAPVRPSQATRAYTGMPEIVAP
jgi:hypothetical protein